MIAPFSNISLDGSPVLLLLDSAILVCMDPLALEMVRDELASLPPHSRTDILLRRANEHHPAMSCYHIPDFRPGLYVLDPRDIHKFGDDESIDYDGPNDDEPDLCAPPDSYPFVAVDSGTLVFADFSHLSRLVELFTWEQYDLAMRDVGVFGQIVHALGGPYFAIVVGQCLPGMDFDGDGVYTIDPGAVKLSRV